MNSRNISVAAQKNYSFLKGYRSKAIVEINRLYVLTSLSVRSLGSLREEIKATKRRAVPIDTVTRHGEIISTTKRKSKIWPIIDSAIRTDLYRTGLIGVVALTEDFLASYLKIFLTAYPLKISKDKKLGVSEIIVHSDIGGAIGTLVDREIVSALYKSPKDYLQYFQDTLSIKLSKNILESYIEIKATRDLLVHNSGTINSVYLAKADGHARGGEGDLIVVDKDYFDSSITTIKELIHSAFEKAVQKHGNSEEVSKANNWLVQTPGTMRDVS